mmetsp:Transcript_100937/g.291961  ORF Transcript_100937/g.291961 Transcript_100937/m.291961 type:complete len:225 (+) Transcript_100937:25-699(+)
MRILHAGARTTAPASLTGREPSSPDAVPSPRAAPSHARGAALLSTATSGSPRPRPASRCRTSCRRTSTRRPSRRNRGISSHQASYPSAAGCRVLRCRTCCRCPCWKSSHCCMTGRPNRLASPGARRRHRPPSCHCHPYRRSCRPCPIPCRRRRTTPSSSASSSTGRRPNRPCRHRRRRPKSRPRWSRPKSSLSPCPSWRSPCPSSCPIPCRSPRGSQSGRHWRR